MQGRVPLCSRPFVGSSATVQTSPREGWITNYLLLLRSPMWSRPTRCVPPTPRPRLRVSSQGSEAIVQGIQEALSLIYFQRAANNLLLALPSLLGKSLKTLVIPVADPGCCGCHLSLRSVRWTQYTHLYTQQSTRTYTVLATLVPPPRASLRSLKCLNAQANRSPEDMNETAFRVLREATGKEKNPAAVALGRLGGKKGGPARAAKLIRQEALCRSPARRP